MTKPKRVALYVRVSTDAQSTAMQRRELQAWAERAGHKVVKVYEDQGISGAKGRDKRPAFDALLKAAVRREYDMLAVWSSIGLGARFRTWSRCCKLSATPAPGSTSTPNPWTPPHPPAARCSACSACSASSNGK